MSGFVYLAGPISGLSYEGCTDWRDFATKVLREHGITGVSPLRAKEYLQHEKIVADSYEQEKIEHPLAHVLSCSRGITTRDRFDCMGSDVVIANLKDAKKVSIGTAMEIAWADANRIPVILVEEDGGLHDHAMIRECAGFRVKTLEEALTVACAILVRG